MVHDGQGLPLPYGEDGSYLILKDGEPAWTDVPDPDPDPVGDGVTWNNIRGIQALRRETIKKFSPRIYWQRLNLRLAGSILTTNRDLV